MTTLIAIPLLIPW